MSDDTSCGAAHNEETHFNLRVGAIFILLVTSGAGSLFPVLAARSKLLNVPVAIFEFAKYFGSGVIIATAFIHLLAPAFEALTSPCLTGVWQTYPWAPAISMMSVFAIFFVELAAFRWGSSRLQKVGGVHYDHHGHEQHAGATHAAHGPETTTDDIPSSSKEKSTNDLEALRPHAHNHEHSHNRGDHSSALAQIVAVVILEFGVIFHSLFIGLTLAVDPQFITLFVVIVFHQTFEGLGLGARLSQLRLPPSYSWAPYGGAIAYAMTTPLGLAIGLGVRQTYNPGSTTASIVSGVLDATSSGILLYTGLVELLAHEFLFNKEMHNASTAKVAYAGGCVVIGAGVMALLGRWA
ncbi:hypothetical protein BOTBODRAFT_28478 [Botryobasidium botryosum FD-172 SS1]|uniref:ZIP zinc/iron transport family n=1 Tax=Botryobasidium botryosum (strain FD-172 SS1) TaxID=930990 RepID=A0A067MTC2_BOTB1|nr:hypothetical protein BOTBODRAFT_28478 [Botryobasidium botryosum FD-172 SS1]